MFSRELFLAVTISSIASIALAGALVESAHEHQYDSNPRYLQHQSVSQHWIRSPTEQYRAEQLPDQESARYLPKVEIKKHEDPKEGRMASKRMEEYGRKMDFIRHMDGGHSLQPSINRRKRSDPTTIDSILPVNEPTDITDKRVEKREDLLTVVIPRYLLSLLPTSLANAIRYIYPYMVIRVGDITIFQAIVNAFGYLFGYSQTTSGRASDGMHIDEVLMLQRFTPHFNKACMEDIAIQYAYPYLVVRVTDIKMFQEIVNLMEYLLDHYPSQAPTISGRASDGMHIDEKITNMNMINTAKPISQDKTLQIPFYSYKYPIVNAPLFDRTGRLSTNYDFLYYPNNNYYIHYPKSTYNRGGVPDWPLD